MNILKQWVCKDVLVELERMISTNAWMTTQNRSLQKRLEVHEKPHFVVTDEWRWFKRKDFYCPCGDDHPQIINAELISRLDFARTRANVPFKITSGYRCEKHNDSIGASSTSSHLKGVAADIACAESQKRFIIIEALLWVGFKRIGIAIDFIHCDLDSQKTTPCVWLYS